MHSTLAAIAALAMLWLTSSLWPLAYAHGPARWIADGHYVSPIDGSHCCGEYDCAEVSSDYVREIRGGYLIKGPVAYGSVAGTVVIDVDEVVPSREVQPSKDGGYWRCKKPDGSRRCVFVPPPGS